TGHLDDGDLAAERGVDGAKLEADVAAADHEQRLRDVGQLEARGRVHHPRAVERERRYARRARPGGQDAVLELQLGLAAAGGDRHRLRARQRGAPLDELHLAQPADLADPARQLVHHALLEGAQRVDVDLRLGKGDAPGGGVARLVDDFRDVEQRFRRDAAAIEADTARV